MTTARNFSRCCVKPPVGQALTADPAQGKIGTFRIRETADLDQCAAFFLVLLAVVVTEVEFAAVAVKVRARNMVVRSDQPALEHGEEAFRRVCMGFAAHIFPDGVVDLIVLREWLLMLEQVVTRGGVRHQVAVGVDLLRQHRLEVLAGHVGNVDRAKLAAALDQGDDLVHCVVRRAAVLALARFAFFRAPVGFVRLDNLASAAKRSLGIGLHRSADSMRHEPRRFVGHAKGAVQLMAAHALLAAAQKVHGLQPDVERDMATLENGADCRGELLAAVLALPKADAVRLTREAVMPADYPAMRADRAVRPADALKMGEGGGDAAELGLVEGGHGELL